MKNKDSYISRLVAQGMLEDEAEKFVNLIVNDVVTSDKAYYIRVDYQTGDSFGLYFTNEDIDLPWHNIVIVKENIKRLEEQVNLYSLIDKYSTLEEIENAKNKWANSDWVVFYEKDEQFSSYGIKLFDGRIINKFSIKLLKDDGTEFQLSTVGWIGYFESQQEFTMLEVNKHII